MPLSKQEWDAKIREAINRGAAKGLKFESMGLQVGGTGKWVILPNGTKKRCPSASSLLKFIEEYNP